MSTHRHAHTAPVKRGERGRAERRLRMTPNRRTALITGAAQGIGWACAQHFLREGWSVVGWDTRPRNDARIQWGRVDVSDWDAVASAAEKLPPLAAAVHCAAIATRSPIIKTAKEEWDRVIAVNLNAVFYVARWLFRPLRQGRGVLVNLASINATNTFANRAAYSCAKAAVLSFTQTLAVEWGPAGIRAFAVSPGFTLTEMTLEAIRAGAIDEKRVKAFTPQRRMLTPAAVARAIVCLVGDDFSGLTGNNVLIDCGFDAWGGRF